MNTLRGWINTRYGAVAALVVLFGALVWPVILGGGGGTSEAKDQLNYHLPAIEGMVDQWPWIDVVNYPSSTAPGYHLLMATVSGFVSGDPMVLQLASSLLSLGFLLVVWHHAARLVRPGAALALVLPLLASSYVLGAAIWLDTDNAAWLFVALALGGSALVVATPSRGFRLALYGAAAVLVRQVHIWVAGPVLLVALLSTGRGRRVLERFTPPRGAPWSRRALIVVLAAVAVPFALLAVMIVLWGGLTPPAYADVHDGGINLAVYPLVLALVGGFGIFFLPAFGPTDPRAWMRDRLLWVAIGLALALSLAVPTVFDREAGRWGGAIWELVRQLPAPGGRSVVFCPLAVLGAVVLVRAWRAAGQAGRGYEAALLLLALLGWVICQSVNTQAWQRYCEPIILVGLAWLAALARSGGVPSAGAAPQTGGRWWFGPVALGFVQLGLSGYSLYWALAKGVGTVGG